MLRFSHKNPASRRVFFGQTIHVGASFAGADHARDPYMAFVAGMVRSCDNNLFYRYRFCKIAWFIHIGALLQRHVIGQQLQRNGVQNRA